MPSYILQSENYFQDDTQYINCCQFPIILFEILLSWIFIVFFPLK